MRFLLQLLIFLLPISSAWSVAPLVPHDNRLKLEKIGHIIIISLENHSFDNLFGHFPGAQGLDQANNTTIQTDLHGKPYVTLPPVMNTKEKPAVVDDRFPAQLANRPFDIGAYVSANEKTGDPTHRFYQQQQQINQGKMDRFAAISNVGGLVMGYYDGSHTTLWRYASQYTLADHFFHAAYGGSFLNHFWLVCACTPRFEHAPSNLVAILSDQGKLLKDGAVTPDGYAVNTLFSVYAPHPTKAKTSDLLPPQTMPTIGDRLSEKGISWAWYAGGWNQALAGSPDPTFQFHHQPLAYFKQFGDGTEAKKQHLQDEEDFLRNLKFGTLPAVSFYKPLGKFTLHPGYADITDGEAHLVSILQAIRQSSVWKDTVVIITFDENGGFWDHVPPQQLDRWGPGVRVPTIIISPFAKRHFVDHTSYDTTSILKLIEMRYGLQPLGTRDAQANAMLNAFDFDQIPPTVAAASR